MECKRILLYGVGDINKNLYYEMIKEKCFNIVAIVNYNLNAIRIKLKNCEERGIQLYRSLGHIENLDKIDLIIIDADLMGENLDGKIVNLDKNIIILSRDFTYALELYEELHLKFHEKLKMERKSILCTAISRDFILKDIKRLLNYISLKDSVKFIKVIRNLENFSSSIVNFFGLGLSKEEFYNRSLDVMFLENNSLKGELYNLIKSINIKADIVEESVGPIISNTFRNGRYITVNPYENAGIYYEVVFKNKEQRVFVYESNYEFIPGKENKKEGLSFGNTYNNHHNFLIDLNEESYITENLILFIIKNFDVIDYGVHKLI